MWLCDLEKAIKAVKEKKGNDTLFTKIEPCWDGGIVFTTTYHTFIKWYPDGTITERGEHEWRTK